MSGRDYCESAEQNLNRFMEGVEEYIRSSNCKFATFRTEFTQVSNLTLLELEELSRDDLLDYSYSLYCYASYLQDELNKSRVVSNWCHQELEILVAKHREDYGFTKFTKHEAKKPVLIFENSFAEKLSELKAVADSRLQILDGKIYEIKRKAEILLEKGKRK